MWGLPNHDGAINIGLHLKVKGHNSYEYFKQDYYRFEQFMHTVYPESKYLMPEMKEQYDKWSLTRFMNMKCYPWRIAKFLLIGDAAHTMNIFAG